MMTVRVSSEGFPFAKPEYGDAVAAGTPPSEITSKVGRKLAERGYVVVEGDFPHIPVNVVIGDRNLPDRIVSGFNGPFEGDRRIPLFPTEEEAIADCAERCAKWIGDYKGAWLDRIRYQGEVVRGEWDGGGWYVQCCLLRLADV